MREEMALDDRVFVIGEDVDLFGGVYNMTQGLVEAFGKARVRGTPISEAAFMGLAAGAAMVGLRPIVEIMYADFIMVAMDQVVNQAAKVSYMSGGQVSVPMVIRAQFGSGTAEAAQHSQHLENWFVHTPGIKVVMPSNPYDAKGLLKSAIRDNNPVLFFENRVLYYRMTQRVPDEEWLVPIGVADVKRVGSDITVVALSDAVNKALKAAQELEDEVSVEVVDPRTLDPLDVDTIVSSLKKTGRMLVVHEAVTKSGFGAEIIRCVVEEGFGYLDAEPRVLGGRNVPVPFSSVLEDAYIPQVEDIVHAIERMVGKQ
jgi:pyruvate dehydrogenase E1 component beta subunit